MANSLIASSSSVPEATDKLLGPIKKRLGVDERPSKLPGLRAFLVVHAHCALRLEPEPVGSKELPPNARRERSRSGSGRETALAFPDAGVARERAGRGSLRLKGLGPRRTEGLRGRAGLSQTGLALKAGTDHTYVRESSTAASTFAGARSPASWRLLTLR